MIIIIVLDTGGILTLPIVFSTLALLQQLRTSIGRQWTRSIETGTYLRALLFLQFSPSHFAASFISAVLH